MRFSLNILCLLIYCGLPAQSFFFQPHIAEDIEDVSHKGLYNTAYGTNVITSAGISNVSLSDGNAFSLELWQYLDSRQTGKSLFRLESSDTASNYMVLRLNADAYIEVEFTNAAGSYFRDTENEVQSAPKRLSGVVENRDWYHIIFTRSAGGSEVLYIDGESVTFSNTSGTFKNIYGDLDLTINNLHQTGPFRIFQKALNSSEAITLYNSGRPRLSTSISNLQLEYTHQEDTWTGSAWTIPDGVASQDATTTGFLEGDMLPINNFDPDQRKSQRIPVGVPYLINWHSGANYHNVNVANRSSSSYLTQGQIGPGVWYDSTTNRTYFAFNDHSGHGGNKEACVTYYDHSNDRLESARKLGHISVGIVDDHPGLSLMVHNNRIETAQEDIHASYLYFRYSDDGLDFTEEVNTTSSTNAYPSFSMVNGVLYCLARADGNNKSTSNRLYTKTGAGNWSFTREVVDLATDWAYSSTFGWGTNASKIIHITLKRPNDSGNFYASGLMLSSDGLLWHNVDSTYSQNVGGGNPIDDAGWDNFQVYETDGITSGQAGFPIETGFCDGKYLLFYREYDTLSTTQNKHVLYWSDGTTDWNTKDIIFLTNKTYRIVHIDGDTYDLFIWEDDVLSRWRTDDFFSTFTHEDEIYSGQLDLTIRALTGNQSEVDEVLILGEGVSSNGLDNHLFIYLYDKTQ